MGVLRNATAELAGDVLAAGVGLLGLELGPADVLVTMGARHVGKKAAHAAMNKVFGAESPSM